MWLIAGLGNPGSKYERNRHNIGFMAMDHIIETHNFSSPKNKYKAECFDGTIGDEKVLIMKPQTYMNNSGISISEAARFYKIPLERVLVFYDELDLAEGKVKAKKGGGSAGHNGIKSLDAHLGNNFWRIRLGIGHPGKKELVHSYVLGDFMDIEKKWLEPMLSSIAKHFPLMVDHGIDKAVSKINQDIINATKPPKEDKKKESVK
ncbi:MAG: aminoacyl-tRNA hydrolase [Rickettsiales bacterium]|nr:aminoacyl-tRNA hydrolase [Rickettsiales bacterium]